MIPEVNYLAVLTAAFINIALGFLWYGPIFGKPWMKLMNFNKETMQKAMKKGMGGTHTLMIIASLVTAYVLSYIVIFSSTYMQTEGVNAGIAVGFWVWLGFAAPLIMDAQLWEQKPWKLFVLNAGYRLVSLLIMSVILATWV